MWLKYKFLFPVFLLFVLVVHVKAEASSLLNFSHNGGFYFENFTLKMEVNETQHTLLYTIDGSNPQISATAVNGGTSASILVNPASTNGRAKTPGFIVRASVKYPDGSISLPVTHSFIYPNEVINQTQHPGGSWPRDNVNGQLMIFGVSTQITNNQHYRSQMTDALLDIQTISVVTDMESLFQRDSGIYVNAWAHGRDWERYCSVELLDPQKGQEFTVGAGLRIRGGWSRHNDFPKHSFRLFFRGVYGETKLRYPLFGSEGTNEFDKIDLRTSQNYAWSNGQSRNTFVREVFSRDSQRDMGVPYTRSRYYHLYINGLYWGLFQTQERSEARYAESYLGGDREDYDVVKVNTDNWNYKVGATDGTMDNWERVWNKCRTGFANNARYFELEGRDRHGNKIPGEEVLVDIDNLIDYMISIFYTGNFDAPMSQFGGNRHANNFYTIFNRNDKTKGFVFFNHDAEHSLMTEPIWPGIGLYENRVEPQGMSVGNLNDFHPQWLHHKLSENAEYRQRFADRAYLHLFNNGVFTPRKCIERFSARADQIDKAIIAESARWGAAKTNQAFTRDNDWLPEIEHVISTFFPYRTDIVIDQLADAGLYVNTSPPVFRVNNNVVHNNETNMLYGETTVNISSSQGGTQIYITTNGTDPRLVGGDINPHARLYSSGESLSINSTTHIKGRVKRGNDWSALNEAYFIRQNEIYDNIKITELNYHPSDTVVGSEVIGEREFEFIEIKNTGHTAVDLSRLRFVAGIDYQFKEKAVLQPREFFILARNSRWFFERYGVAPTDVYKKAFSNDGELVVLLSHDGRLVAGFEYSTTHPWPEKANGMGRTLTSAQVNPTGNPNDPEYWKESTYVNGSPFNNDAGHKLNNDVFSGIAASLMAYPNPSSGLLFFKSDNTEVVHVEITTLSGREIFKGELNTDSHIDLRELNVQPGLLIVRMKSTEGNRVQKIMLRH